MAELSSEPDYRISNGKAFLMNRTANVYDGFQALLGLVGIGLILDSFISMFVWLHFYFWFKISGVSFTKTKRVGTFFGAGFAELMPVINMLPAWSIAVHRIIKDSHKEDEEEHAELLAKVREEEGILRAQRQQAFEERFVSERI